MPRPLSARVILFTVGNVVRSAASILLGILLARYLTKQDMGTYQQLWLVQRLIVGLVLAGVSSSLLYFVPSLKREQQRSLLVFISMSIGAVAAVTSLVMVVGAPWIAARFNNPALGPLLRLFAAYIFLATSVQHFSNYLVARGRHEMAAAYQVMVTVAIIVSAIYGMAVGGGLEEITLAIVVTMIPLWIWASSWIVVQCFCLPRGESISAYRVIGYSAHLSLAGASNTLLQQIGPLAVSLLASPAQVAVFRMGATQVPMVTSITGSVAIGLTPTLAEQFARGDIRQMTELWHRAIRRLFGLILPMFVFFFLMASDIIVVLFSIKYMESITIFRIYLCIMLLRSGFYSGVLQAMGRSREILFVDIISSLVAVILAFALMPVIGLRGPAVACVVGYYTGGLLFLILICRFTGHRWSSVMPWRDINRQLGIAILAGVVMVPVLWYHHGEYSLKFSAIRILAAALLYFPICFAMLQKAGYPVIGDLWKRLRWRSPGHSAE